jgi:hypothetical protein
MDDEVGSMKLVAVMTHSNNLKLETYRYKI